MLLAIIVLLLSLNIFLIYQWGVTAVREYRNGYEKGTFDYQDRVRAHAEVYPTLTARELYEKIKIKLPDEESRQD